MTAASWTERLGEALRLDSRSVVRMATGAALYGVFSWMTNVVPMPSVSLITFRPAVVIPVFFGFTWGPRVGFFTGLVGNLIGDTLTGWGVFPTWDLGNGLLGMICGFSHLAGVRRLSVDALALVAAAGLLLFAWLMSRTTGELGEGGWLPPNLVIARHWPWPAGLGLIVLVAWLTTRNQLLGSAAVLWGLFGVFGGLGTAALLDIWYNGLTLQATMIGQFLPATVSNSLVIVLFVPPLARAYERALVQAGR